MGLADGDRKRLSQVGVIGEYGILRGRHLIF